MSKALFDITVDVTEADLAADQAAGRPHAAPRRWIDEAAKTGIATTLVGLPCDGFSDGDGGSLLALVRVDGANVVLTISDPYGKSHTIRARQPYDREVDWFSDNNL